MAVIRLRRLLTRLPVVMTLLIQVFVASACTATTVSAVPAALDPGGGLAIFPAGPGSDELGSCVAQMLADGLPNVRIVSGLEASAMALGIAGGKGPPGGPAQPTLADLLQAEARARLNGSGIRHIVTLRVSTETGGYETTRSLDPVLLKSLDRRSSDGDATVYDARSGDQVVSVRAHAEGSVGVVVVLFVLPIPLFAYTEFGVCKAIGGRLVESFGGAKGAK